MVEQSARVPRLVAGVDLTELPLSPLEGFVLSRIDGAADLATLGDLTNLGELDVTKVVKKLIELGAVEWARESVSLPRATGRPPTRTPSGPVNVPPSLRTPAHRRTRGPVRIVKPSAKPRSTDGVYKGAAREDRVESARRPSVPPRASHTGSMFPPGEVDDADEADDLLAEAERELEAFAEEADEAEAMGTAETVRPPPADDEIEDLPGEDSGLHALFDAASMLADAAGVERETFPELNPVGVRRLGAPSEAEAEPETVAESEPVAEPEPESETESVAEPVAEAEPESVGGAGAVLEEDDEEELDLDAARRKRIDDLYFALDLLDHYRVLGVERDADRKEIRHAYFTLSKVFHPDTMFRKRLGSYKAKMESIFQRLTEAYEVLGKKRPRADYDRYLGLQDQTRAVERATGEIDAQGEEAFRAAEEAARQEADIAAGRSVPPDEPTEPEVVPEPEATPTSTPTSSQAPTSERARPAPTREMTEAGRRRAKELMARKLRSAARAASARRGSSSPPAAPPADGEAHKSDRKQLLKSLAGSLRQTASQTGGVDPLRRHVLMAERAKRKGDLAEAAAELRLAMALDPEDEELRERHAAINSQLASSMSTTYEEQALYEQRHGKWGAAALSWAKVFEGRPSDAKAARMAAEALVEAKGDLHKAKSFAQKAAELEPDNIENLRALGRIYLAAGLTLNARRVLQRAAVLDPADEMVENLLRDLDA